MDLREIGIIDDRRALRAIQGPKTLPNAQEQPWLDEDVVGRVGEVDTDDGHAGDCSEWALAVTGGHT